MDNFAKQREPRARLIAFYLPQFHPIPENDHWWGKGFTEWTNVARAKPLFPGHYQPRIPADLGFYDLRIPEVRQAQADLARYAGIEGFCYWHYWFAGKRLLERPFNEVLASGQPSLPFCLGWANHSWNGVWVGAAQNQLLIEQTYPGLDDHERHFHTILPAFHDPRYIRVRNRPVFVVFRPADIPGVEAYIALWQQLAQANGLDGIHFVAHIFGHDDEFDWKTAGYDAALMTNELKLMRRSFTDVILKRLQMVRNGSDDVKVDPYYLNAGRAAVSLGSRRIFQRLLRWPGAIHDYENAMLFFHSTAAVERGCYPSMVPGWDNTARAGRNGVILHNSTPQLFANHARAVLESVDHRDYEDRLVFVKSWNEWAEGNYLEPDLRYGMGYLDAIRTAMEADRKCFSDRLNILHGRGEFAKSL